MCIWNSSSDIEILETSRADWTVRLDKVEALSAQILDVDVVRCVIRCCQHKIDCQHQLEQCKSRLAAREPLIDRCLSYLAAGPTSLRHQRPLPLALELDLISVPLRATSCLEMFWSWLWWVQTRTSGARRCCCVRYYDWQLDLLRSEICRPTWKRKCFLVLTLFRSLENEIEIFANRRDMIWILKCEVLMGAVSCPFFIKDRHHNGAVTEYWKEPYHINVRIRTADSGRWMRPIKWVGMQGRKPSRGRHAKL